jgi:hypothetical protein
MTQRRARMAWARRGLLCACLALAACTQSAADAPSVDQWATVPIEVRQVALDAETIGHLRFRGALQLSVEQRGTFGGLSGLEVLEDQRLIAISDYGAWFEAHLTLDDAGNLIGLTDARSAPMRDEGGLPFTSKEAADAEDLTQLPDGRFAVSFEQTQSIRIYDLNRDGPFGAARAGPALEGVERLPPNVGLEALSVTADGVLVVGAEGGDAPTTPVWLAPLDAHAPVPATARYPLERGYALTGLDRLPNGDFIALERFYAPVIGPRARITRFSGGALAQGGELSVEELARLAPPEPVDNFEGISTVRAPDGGVRIYIISDDNFSDRQRTLLLAFDVID